MSVRSDLYKGVRPSDMRFENVHLLAEYIEQCQRIVEASDRSLKYAEKLLGESVDTSEKGVSYFSTAMQQLKSSFQHVESALESLIRRESSSLMRESERMQRIASGLAITVRQAIAERDASYLALASLKSYRGELELYEKQTMEHIRDARRRLYRGVGFWRRLWFVVSPPRPDCPAVKQPKRPVAFGLPPKSK